MSRRLLRRDPRLQGAGFLFALLFAELPEASHWNHSPTVANRCDDPAQGNRCAAGVCFYNLAIAARPLAQAAIEPAVPSLTQVTGAVYPEELRQREDELVRRRREIATDVGLDAPMIGVACSGGGIRSATACLGVFQAFAKHGLLPRIDYISTISGGGYFGSFLGSLYLPRSPDTGADPRQIPGAVAECLSHDQSPPVKWLRKHGRYIAPDGPADYANIVAIYIRNWIGVQYVIGVTFLTLFFLLFVVRAALGAADLDFLRSGWPFQSLYDLHLSPFLVVPLALLLLHSVPLGCAFWLTQYGTDAAGPDAKKGIGRFSAFRIILSNNMPLWALLFIVAVCAAALASTTRERAAEGIVPAVVLLVCVLSLGYWMWAEAGVPRLASTEGKTSLNLSRRQSFVRNQLSDGLGTSLHWLAAFLAIGLIDSAAQTIYEYLANLTLGGTIAVSVSSLVAALLALVHRLAPLLQRARGIRSHWSWWTIAAFAGLVAMVLIVLLWDLIAYAITFRGAAADWNDIGVAVRLAPYLLTGLALTFLVGRTLTFLNLSSLQSFYSARLRRAYLGASNPTRTGYCCNRSAPAGAAPPATARATSIRTEVRGDDHGWTEYRPHAFGGPLHLIGVTVNHTVGRGSDIDLRDRKGFTMTIGPAGFSGAVESHALLEGDALVPLPRPSGQDPVFGKAGTAVRAEPCALSRWMAISGAAFSTGLGSKTRTGVSILLGAANVRLGYWWASGAAADEEPSVVRTWFRTQAYLGGELLGRFAGTGYRDWYLSDGGHSENTGAYELIRRRLPLIVLLDHGADPGYEFEDFGNLVRRVRIDFGAEITALGESEWARWGLCASGASASGLAGLRRARTGDLGVALAHGAIASFKVTYEGSDVESLLVLAKPTLVGDEPEDVLNYAKLHPAFPQEPTSDQFFDEAQWESYRRLGEHIGAKVCRLRDWRFAKTIA